MIPENENEFMLVRIKDGSLGFIADIFKYSAEWLEEHYPDMKGYVRNGKDGCYELFALPKNQEHR